MTFGALLLLCTIAPQYTDPDHTKEYQNLCGPMCVAYILSYFHTPAQTRQILPLTHYDPDIGTTLLDLADTIKHFGLSALPIEASHEELAQLMDPDTAALMWMPNHFVVLIRTEERLLLVDPSRGAITPFTGGPATCRAALVSKQSLQPQKQAIRTRQIHAFIGSTFLGITIMICIICFAASIKRWSQRQSGSESVDKERD